MFACLIIISIIYLKFQILGICNLATPFIPIHTSRLFAVMQSLTGASNKFSSIYHGKNRPFYLPRYLQMYSPFFSSDTSANPYKKDVNSNLHGNHDFTGISTCIYPINVDSFIGRHRSRWPHTWMAAHEWQSLPYSVWSDQQRGRWEYESLTHSISFEFS